MALAAAAKAVLGDSITDCTREPCPLALPSWIPLAPRQTQGLWARYTLRFPFKGMLEARDGYENVLPGEAVALSILLATFQRFVRYLNKDRRDDTKNGAAEQPTAPRRPQRLTRHFWDDVPDDPTHPCFDAALSQMLPGENLFSRCVRRHERLGARPQWTH